MAVVILALLAATFAGFSSFGAGVMSRRIPVLSVLAVSMPAGVLIAAVIVPFGLDSPPARSTVTYALLAGATAAIGTSALYRGLAVGSMGVVAPIAALAPVVPLCADVFRGEELSALQLGGSATALAGVVVASWSRTGGASRIALGAGFAVIAALGFGTTMLGISVASRGDPYWATIVLRLSMAAVILAAVGVKRPKLYVAYPIVLVLGLIGILDACSATMFALASTRGAAGVVAVLASLFPLVVIVLARVVLGERLTHAQRAGAGAALIGVALISAG